MSVNILLRTGLAIELTHLQNSHKILVESKPRSLAYASIENNLRDSRRYCDGKSGIDFVLTTVGLGDLTVFPLQERPDRSLAHRLLSFSSMLRQPMQFPLIFTLRRTTESLPNIKASDIMRCRKPMH